MAAADLGSEKDCVAQSGMGCCADCIPWHREAEHESLDAQARLERHEAAERTRKAKKAAAKEAKLMSLSNRCRTAFVV